MSLLNGPVVFIDDELADEGSQAHDLVEAIRQTGRPVAAQRDLPEPPDDWVDHWRSLAFIVLDWDLTPGSHGHEGSATLQDFKREELFDFLAKVMDSIFCPIFIISAQDMGHIQSQIEADSRLTRESGQVDGRIKVFSKSELVSDVVAHLEAWVATSPPLSAVQAWEREYEAAKQSFFLNSTNSSRTGPHTSGTQPSRTASTPPTNSQAPSG